MPSLLVVVAVSTPVAVLVATTFALGMTAPEASVTVPVTLAVMVCALAVVQHTAIRAMASRWRVKDLRCMVVSSEKQVDTSLLFSYSFVDGAKKRYWIVQ